MARRGIIISDDERCPAHADDRGRPPVATLDGDIGQGQEAGDLLAELRRRYP
jgi:hypothetical protein